MAEMTLTVAGVGTVTLDTDTEVTAVAVGGNGGSYPSGTYVFKDAAGNDVDVFVGGETESKVFACNTATKARVDAIVAAVAAELAG